MKTFVLAIVFLVLGTVLGILSSYRNFAGEMLPSKPFLDYIEQRRDPALSSAPRLVMVGAETYDFGSMDLWGRGGHVFKVRNDGTEKLRMTLGETTCSCTTAEKLKKGDSFDIMPGEEKSIKLEWEIRSSHEQFSQSAEFLTNDPQRRKLTLAIMGRVEESVRRSRETVVFSNVPASATATEIVELYTNRTDKLAIAGHRWLKPELSGFFDLRFEPMSAEEAAKRSSSTSGVLVLITLKPGMSLGRFDQTLEVTTNLAPAVPPFQIPIQGTVVGDISIFGVGVNPATRTLNLGDVRQGVGMKRKIHILVKGPHRDTTKFSIDSVEPASLHGELGEALAENPNVRMYPLTIEVPADAPVANFTGETDGGRIGRIVINTTHPTVKRLEIDVLFLVR